MGPWDDRQAAELLRAIAERDPGGPYLRRRLDRPVVLVGRRGDGRAAREYRPDDVARMGQHRLAQHRLQHAHQLRANRERVHGAQAQQVVVVGPILRCRVALVHEGALIGDGVAGRRPAPEQAVARGDARDLRPDGEHLVGGKQPRQVQVAILPRRVRTPVVGHDAKRRHGRHRRHAHAALLPLRRPRPTPTHRSRPTGRGRGRSASRRAPSPAEPPAACRPAPAPRSPRVPA